MSSYIQKANIKPVFLISLLLCCLTASSLILAWFLAFPVIALVMGILALVFFCLCLVLVVYKKLQNESDEALSGKNLHRQLSEALNQSGGHRKYQTSCFLAVSSGSESSLLKTMGFQCQQAAGDEEDQQTPFIEVWRGHQSLLLNGKINGAVNDQPEAEAALTNWISALKLIRKKRPRQPLSGLIILLPFELLGDMNEDCQSFLTIAADICNLTARELRQNIPITFLLTGLGQVHNFGQLCQTLHRDELASPLGAVRPDGVNDNIGIGDWLTTSWQEQLQLLYARETESLGQIYDQNQACHCLNAIFQLALLGDKVKSALLLFNKKLSQPELSVASYFLCYNMESTQAIDLVALYNQCHHGAGSAVQQNRVPTTQNAFIREIVSRALLPLTGRAGVNKQSQRIYRLFQIFLFSLGLITLAATTWCLYINYSVGNQYNKDITMIISRYSLQDYKTEGTNDQSLVKLLKHLSSIRGLINEFNDTPFYLFPLRKNYRKVNAQVKAYYHDQLKLRLTPYLIETFSNSLKLKIQQNHAHGIFESLRFYLMLFDPSVINQEELSTTAPRLLSDYYNIDKAYNTRLTTLLNDYFSLQNYPTYQPDTVLLMKAREKIEGLTEAHLVYRRIKLLPEFYYYIPLEKMMGTHYKRVFAIDSGTTTDCEKGHFALFTARGWKSDLSPESQHILKSLEDIRKLQGIKTPVSFPTAVAISRAVRKRFTQEYISRWHGFLSCINIKPTGTIAELQDVVSLLAQWGKSPMTDTLDLIKANTWFPKPEPQEDEDSYKKNHIHLLSEEYDVLFDEDDILTATFSDYHQLVDQQQGTHFFQQLQPLLEEIYQNLHLLKENSNPEAFAFRQILRLNSDRHPVKSMDTLSMGQPEAVQRWLSQLISQWVKIHLALASQHLQKLWESQILTPWQNQLSGRFPVNPDSKQNADLEYFSDMFGSRGKLVTFQQDYVQPFLSNGETAWKTGQHKLRFSPELLNLFSKVQNIQSACFDQNGHFDIEMQVTVDALSTRLTHMTLNDGISDIVYNHGPSFWHKVRWPAMDDKQKLSVSFYSSDKLMSQVQYEGVWRWLRLLQQSRLEMDVDTDILTAIYESEGHTTRILMKGVSSRQGIGNILSALKDLSLPDLIFQ